MSCVGVGEQCCVDGVELGVASGVLEMWWSCVWGGRWWSGVGFGGQRGVDGVELRFEGGVVEMEWSCV